MIGKKPQKRYPENAAFAVSGCTFCASMCAREIRCRNKSKRRRSSALRKTALRYVPIELGSFPKQSGTAFII